MSVGEYDHTDSKMITDITGHISSSQSANSSSEKNNFSWSIEQEQSGRDLNAITPQSSLKYNHLGAIKITAINKMIHEAFTASHQI